MTPSVGLQGACRLGEAAPEPGRFASVPLLTFMTETMGSVSSDSRPITDSTCSQAEPVSGQAGQAAAVSCSEQACKPGSQSGAGRCRRNNAAATIRHELQLTDHKLVESIRPKCRAELLTLLCRRMLHPGSSCVLSTKDMMLT